MKKTIVVRITWEWDNEKGITIPRQKDIEVVLSPADPTFMEYVLIIYGGEVELNKYIEKHFKETSVKNASIEILLNGVKIAPEQYKIRSLENYGKKCSDNCIIIVLCILTENDEIFEFPIGRICVIKQGENRVVINLFVAGKSLYPIVGLAYLHNLQNGECLNFSEELLKSLPSLSDKLVISSPSEENDQRVYILANKLLQ